MTQGSGKKIVSGKSLANRCFQQDFFAVGRIAKAHGLRGEIRLYPYSDPESLSTYRTLYAEDLQGSHISFRVLACRIKKKRSIVLRLSGIENRLQADALAGIELYYPKADLPPLAEGEYYWHQLEGIEVADSDGNILGTLLNIIEAGYHDVYVVKGDPGEILIPATKKMVKKIDVDRGLMIVDLPPGLIEANAF